MDLLDVELGQCVYDDQALARLVGEELEQQAEARQGFIVSALNTVDEMRRAASDGNTATLSDLAKRLLSACRMIGAVALETAAASSSARAPVAAPARLAGSWLSWKTHWPMS